MSGFLVILFLNTLLFFVGLVLAFAGDEKSKRYGVYMMLAAIIIYCVCYMLYPKTNKYPV